MSHPLARRTAARPGRRAGRDPKGAPRELCGVPHRRRDARRRAGAGPRSRRRAGAVAVVLGSSRGAGRRRDRSRAGAGPRTQLVVAAPGVGRGRGGDHGGRRGIHREIAAAAGGSGRWAQHTGHSRSDRAGAIDERRRPRPSWLPTTAGRSSRRSPTRPWTTRHSRRRSGRPSCQSRPCPPTSAGRWRASWPPNWRPGRNREG